MRRLVVGCVVVLVCGLARPAAAAIAFDAGTYGGAVTATSQTVAHTVSGSNRCLLVGVLGDTASNLITGVTYAGSALTLVTAAQLHNRYLYLYMMIPPATGTNNVVISASGVSYIQSWIASYTGVRVTACPDVVRTANNSAAPLATTLTTLLANAWTVELFASSGGYGQTTNFKERVNDADCNCGRIGDHGPIVTPGATTMTVDSAGVNESVMVSLAPVPDVTLTTSDNPVTVVAGGSPGGTYVFLCPGVTTGCVYRLTGKIVPQPDDTYTTTQGAVLSGALVLTAPIAGAGIWHYNSVTRRSPDSPHTGTSANCDAGILRCQYPEDLFIDNVEKRQVASTGAVVAGTWFYDYAANVVYVGDDPTGHTVELSVVENAFKSAVANVTISNLVIEKFAVLVQHGAIEDSGSTGGWNVHHTELRYNHGRGVTIGNRWHLHHNNIHHNFQMGIGGGGSNSLVDFNTIAYNRSAVVGIDRGWEAGGTKFALTTNLIVRLNNVHHNDGIALWTDISNRNCEYSSNTVDDNTWAGIMHEISFACVIRDNVIRRNGLTHPNVAIGGKQCFIPDAGIFIAASSNVQVYGNYLEGNADGICGLQQDRTSDETTFGEAAGSYQVRGLSVHDNTLASAATGTAATGISADYLPTNVVDETGTYSGAGHPVETRQPAGSGYNNHFQCNRYYTGDGTAGNSFWQFTGYATFAQWQALGHDTGSTRTCIAANGTVGTYGTFASYTPFTPKPSRPQIWRLRH